MEHKQIVTTKNMEKMLRPCMIAGDYSTNLYQVFELESMPDKYPITYAFSIHGNSIDVFKPTQYNLHGGLCESLAALKPTFQELDFTPVAFVTTHVQGPLNKLIDPKTREYDMRKHADLDFRLPQLSVQEVQEQSKIFTNMYKFIVRDNKTNKIKSMPYYVDMNGSDSYFDKIATDVDIKSRFIMALKKMRQK